MLMELHKIGTNAVRLVRSALVGVGRTAKSKSRVPALQRSGASTRKAAAIRQAILHHGHHAVLLDDKAEVTVYFESKR